MTLLNRWDPFSQMDDLTRLLDNLWENSPGTGRAGTEPPTWSIPLDVFETEKNFVVRASLPGVTPADLEVTFTDNTLVIRGEVQMQEARQGEQVHLRERRFGRFARSINLPTYIEAEKINAQYDHGVLVLTLPKSEQARPKRISVQTGKSTKVLEGKFENLASKN
jgi:HSP20 family protein